MKMKAYISFLFCSVVSCNTPGDLSVNKKAVIINEVKATFSNYYNDIKQNGLTAEFKYLDSSTDFFWVPPGFKNHLHYDSVAIILRQNAGNFKSIDNKIESLEIFPLTKRLQLTRQKFIQPLQILKA